MIDSSAAERFRRRSRTRSPLPRSNTTRSDFKTHDLTRSNLARSLALPLAQFLLHPQIKSQIPPISCLPYLPSHPSPFTDPTLLPSQPSPPPSPPHDGHYSPPISPLALLAALVSPLHLVATPQPPFIDPPPARHLASSFARSARPPCPPFDSARRPPPLSRSRTSSSAKQRRRRSQRDKSESIDMRRDAARRCLASSADLTQVHRP